MRIRRKVLKQTDRPLRALYCINAAALTPSYSPSIEFVNSFQADSSLGPSQERLVSVTATHIHLSYNTFWHREERSCSHGTVCVLECGCVLVVLCIAGKLKLARIRRGPMLSETAWESCIFNVTSQTANNVRGAEPCGVLVLISEGEKHWPRSLSDRFNGPSESH